jgi:hypothetical protein
MAIAFFVFVCNVMPRWRDRLFIIFSLAAWLMFSNEGFIPLAAIMHNYYDYPWEQRILIRLAPLALGLLVCWGAWWLASKFKVFPLLPLFVVFVAFMSLLAFFSPTGWWAVLGWGALAFYLRTFFHLVVLSSDTNSVHFHPKYLFGLCPFWNQNLIPITGIQSELESTRASSSRELRQQGVHLIAACVAFSFGLAFIEHLVSFRRGGIFEELFRVLQFPNLGYASIREIGIKSFIAAPPPTYFQWADLLLGALSFIFEQAVLMGLSVAALLLMGYKIEWPFDRPWHARSYFDFLRRLNVHYVRLLVIAFFQPVWGALSRIRKLHQLRMFIATLITIGFGSFFCHSFVFAESWVGPNPLSAWIEHRLPALPTYLISGFIAGSSLLWAKRKTNVYGMVFVYFIVFAFILRLKAENWPYVLLDLKLLFPFGG